MPSRDAEQARWLPGQPRREVSKTRRSLTQAGTLCALGSAGDLPWAPLPTAVGGRRREAWLGSPKRKVQAGFVRYQNTMLPPSSFTLNWWSWRGRQREPRASQSVSKGWDKRSFESSPGSSHHILGQHQGWHRVLTHSSGSCRGIQQGWGAQPRAPIPPKPGFAPLLWRAPVACALLRERCWLLPRGGNPRRVNADPVLASGPNPCGRDGQKDWLVTFNNH